MENLKQELFEALMVQSNSDNEKRMVLYICDKLRQIEGVTFEIDEVGNVLASKGHGQKACYIAHMDTVHEFYEDFVLKMDVPIIEEEYEPRYGLINTYKPPYFLGSTVPTVTKKKKKKKKKLKNKFNEKTGVITAWSGGKQVGTGGDDKCGVFLCLQMMKELDNVKCAFLSQEETGCQGADSVDLLFFDDVNFIMAFDNPFGDQMCYESSSKELCDTEFGKGIIEKYGYKRDTCTITDIAVLKKRGLDMAMCNMSVGYYSQHTSKEYVVLKEVLNCREMALEFARVYIDKVHHQPKPDKGNYCSVDAWTGKSRGRYVNHWDDCYYPSSYQTVGSALNKQSPATIRDYSTYDEYVDPAFNDSNKANYLSEDVEYFLEELEVWKTFMTNEQLEFVNEMEVAYWNNTHITQESVELLDKMLSELDIKYHHNKQKKDCLDCVPCRGYDCVLWKEGELGQHYNYGGAECTGICSICEGYTCPFHHTKKVVEYEPMPF